MYTLDRYLYNTILKENIFLQQKDFVTTFEEVEKGKKSELLSKLFEKINKDIFNISEDEIIEIAKDGKSKLFEGFRSFLKFIEGIFKTLTIGTLITWLASISGITAKAFIKMEAFLNETGILKNKRMRDFIDFITKFDIHMKNILMPKTGDTLTLGDFSISKDSVSLFSDMFSLGIGILLFVVITGSFSEYFDSREEGNGIIFSFIRAILFGSFRKTFLLITGILLITISLIAAFKGSKNIYEKLGIMDLFKGIRG